MVEENSNLQFLWFNLFMQQSRDILLNYEFEKQEMRSKRAKYLSFVCINQLMLAMWK